MSDEGPLRASAGMAALQMAEAHLSTLLSATDALDGKANVIIALNAAFFSVLLGALISATEPTRWVAVSPVAPLIVLILLTGWWTVKPRDMDQFIRPRELLRHQTGGFDNDQLAWSYVESIAEACDTLSVIVDKKSFGIGVLALLSVLHFVALAASAAVWIP